MRTLTGLRDYCKNRLQGKGVEAEMQHTRNRRENAMFYAVVEALEPRLLLSISVTGASSVNEGSPYALDLHADPQDNITSWTVNWGDGPVNYPLTSSNTVVVHSYPDGPSSQNITVSATTSAGTTIPEPIQIDKTFGHNGELNLLSPSPGPLAIFSQDDGKIIVVSGASGQQDLEGATGINFTLTRYDSRGSVDVTFGNEGSATTFIATESGLSGTSYLYMLSNGKKRLFAYVTSATGTRQTVMIQYNSDGSLDNSFGTGGTTICVGYLKSLNIASDGSLTGLLYSEPNYGVISLVRYIANGTPDSTYGSNGVQELSLFSTPHHDYIYGAVAIQDDGKILISAYDTEDGFYDPTLQLWRFDADGTVDTTFNFGMPISIPLSSDVTVPTEGDISQIVVQSTGKIVILITQRGEASVDDGSGSVGGGGAAFLMRYNSDGTLDSTFGNGGTSYAALGYQNDHYYLIGDTSPDPYYYFYYGPIKLEVTADDGLLAVQLYRHVTEDVYYFNETPNVTSIYDSFALAYSLFDANGGRITRSEVDLNNTTLASYWDSSQLIPSMTYDPIDGSMYISGAIDKHYGPNGIYDLNQSIIHLSPFGSNYLLVNNVPPRIDISGNASATEGIPYTLTLGDVTDPGQDTISEYKVDWGDGVTSTYTTNGEKSHTYASGDFNGAHVNIQVSLADEDGTYNDVATKNIPVLDAPPVVAATAPANGLLGNAISLSATALDPDGDSPIQKVLFYDGDKLIGRGSLVGGTAVNGNWTIPWIPSAGGTHQIHAVATSSFGNSTTSASVAVNITVQSNVVFSYVNDFEDPTKIGVEWSSHKTERTPIGNRGFLGEFGWSQTTGNDKVSLNFGSLPQHDTITISFDLYMIRTWGGYYGEVDSDTWDLVAGGQTLLRTNFSNNSEVDQAYPENLGGNQYPGFTGAVEQDTLGYYYDSSPLDSVYHITYTIPNTSASMVFQFFSENAENLSNESWGLDNVHVTASWHTDTLPPKVNIVVPIDQPSVEPNTPIQLQAYASDLNPNGSVTGVMFYDNGTPIGAGNLTDTAAGLWMLNWSTPDFGSHTITAEATNGSGITASSSNSRSISVIDESGIQPADISNISYNLVGNHISFSVQLADPSADDGSLTYYWSPDSWPNNNVDGAYPQLDWDINGTNAAKNMEGTLPGIGTYDFHVTTFNGRNAATKTVEVTVNPPATGTPPTVSMTSPTSTSSVVANSDTILMATASAADPSDNLYVQFFDDGNLIGTTASFTTTADGTYWEIDWAPPTSGNHTITARATSYGRDDVSADSNPLTLNILPEGTHIPPQFTGPLYSEFASTSGDQDLLGRDLSLVADPEDDSMDSSIIYAWHWTLNGDSSDTVAFSDNGTNSAKVTSVKFSAAGVYNFWLVATDADGASTASAPITITVVPTFSSAQISPNISTILPDGTVQLAMTNVVDQFRNAYNAANWSVTWIADGSGSIDSTGNYTAPPELGTYYVTADLFDKNTNSHFFGQAAINVAAVEKPGNVQGASFPQAIQLTWDDSSSDDRSGWNVYRLEQTSGTPPAYVELNTSLITNTLGFNDETAPVQQTSTYRVTLVNNEGEESEPVTINVYRALHGEPSAPSSVSGMHSGPGSLQLTWPAVTPVEDLGHAGDALAGYNIYRWNTSTLSYQKLNTTPINDPTYTDTGLSLLTPYTYIVRTVDQDGDVSGDSPVCTVQTGDGVGPATPLSFSASTLTSSSAIHLEWTIDPDSAAPVNFLLYRATSSTGPFIDATPPSFTSATTSYDDSSVAPATHYYYKLVAIDGQGDPSSPLTSDVSSNPASPSAPYIQITSPSSIQLITGTLDVHGIVDDPNNDLASWTLALQPLSDAGSSNVIIAQGTIEQGAYYPENPGADTDALLGTINAMLFRDGLYKLVLDATDAAGHSSTEVVGPQIQIQSDQKIGNFNFSETDLSIPANGGTVDITRTYDSLDRSIVNGSGYGWQLNIDAQIEEASNIRQDMPTSPGDEIGGTVSVRVGGDRDVYVTLPTGQRVKFDFDPGSMEDIPQNGNLYQAKFAPDGLNYGATLSLLPDQQTIQEGTNILTGLSSPYFRDGEFAPDENVLDNVDFFDMEDIRGYILTTSDGTKYYFEKDESAQTQGSSGRLLNYAGEETNHPLTVYHLYDGKPTLRKIVDAHGNETDLSQLSDGSTLLSVIPSGLTSAIEYAKVTRDSAGRATAIFSNVAVDGTGGNELVEYEYDNSTGDLAYVNRKTLDSVGATDAVWITTKYGYTHDNPVVDHALNQMFTPANVNRNTSGNFVLVLQNDYDPQNGVLQSTTTFDETGSHTTNFTTNLVSRIESIQDATGQTTIYQYDELGNILFQTNPLGNVTAYTYFANTHNVQSQTDSYGTRDANGVVTLNSSAVTHYYTYDNQNAQTSDTYTFDGHTLTTITAYIDVNNQHLVWFTVDVTGLTTRNSYDSQGNLTETDVFQSHSVIDQQQFFNNLLQKTTYDVYDTRGNLLSTTIWNKDTNGWYRYSKTVNEYDVNIGQMTSTRVYGFAAHEYDWATFDDTVYPDDQNDGDGLILLQYTQMGYNSAGDLTSTNQSLKGPIYGWTQQPGTSNIYDDLHRIIESDDQTGQTKTFYTPTGQVDHTINNRGNVTQYIYNSLNQVTETRTAASLDDLNSGNYTKTTQTYDADGRVITSTDALGNTTFNIYDAAGNLIDSLTTNSTESRTIYDAAGRAEWTTDAYNSTSTINNLNNSMSSRATHTTYDALGRVTSTERYAGVGVAITGVVLPNGYTGYQSSLEPSVIIPGDTNHDGRVDLIDLQTIATHWQAQDPTNPDGTPLTNTQMEAWGDVNHNGMVDLPDLQALATHWQTFSSTNNFLFRLSATHYDAYGRVASTTDASGQTTSYQYDVLGRQIAVIQPAVNVFNPTSSSNDPVHPTTNYEYDALGRQTAIEAPWTWTKDASGTSWIKTRLRTETQYNELGQAIAVLTEQVLLNTDGSDGAVTVLSSTSTAYDSLGRKISSTDAVGQTTTYVYNQAGNLTDVYLPAVPDPNNFSAMTSPHYQYLYNSYGDEIGEIDPNNDNQPGDYTSFTYDAFGRQWKRTLPATATQAAATETTLYDQYGRILTHTDFDGNITSYVYSDTLDPTTDPNYSKAGRLVSEKHYNSAGDLQTQSTFTYDSLGRLTSIADASGTTSYGYDAENRLASVTQAINLPQTDDNGVSQYTGTISYGYDDATGRLTRITSTNTHDQYGTDNVYSYDALGRLTKITTLQLGKVWATMDSSGNIPSSAPTTVYSYDAVGNLLSVKSPFGDKTSYQYNVQNQLLNESIYNAAGALEQTYSYTLRADGNRTDDLEVTWSGSTPLSADNVEWIYDADDRLTSEIRDSVSTSNMTFASITSGNVTIPTNGTPEYKDVYTLDLSGNRLTKVHTDANSALDDTLNYGYDSRDELNTENSSLNGNTTYFYDANGSTISKASGGNTTLYKYDSQNRLIGVDTNGDGVVDTIYVYDTNGNRALEYNPITYVGTLFITDSNNPTGSAQTIEERTFSYSYDDDGNLNVNISLRMAYLLGLSVVAQSTTSRFGDLLTDGHGNTRILNTYKLVSGNLTLDPTNSGAFTFDAFGDAWGFNPNTAKTNHLLNAMSFDAVSGWNNDRARWYVSSTGEFSTADDQGYSDNNDPITLHKYLYCNGDPVNGFDPSGHGDETLVGNLMVLGGLTLLAAIVLISAAKSSAGSALAAAIAREISELMASGESAAIGVAQQMARNTQQEIQAAKKALALTGILGLASSPPPIFPVPESILPTIYANTRFWLLLRPDYYILTYPGPNPALTAKNRAAALRGLPPAGFPLSWDEFPYASTYEGGAGSFVARVSIIQNVVQGGMLGAFYRYVMKSAPGKFLVLPVP